MKKLLRKICLFLCVGLLTVSTAGSTLTITYCGNDTPSAENINSADKGSQLATDLGNGMTEAAKTIKGIATGACILVLTICLLCVIFSRDSRKISGYIGWGITALLAFVGIIIVNSTWITDFLTELTEKYFQ